ncbi:MAG: hypothetical protein IH595_11170 [Bacteroidales bacterium]|nr:hypothetical protein [Bacteroidales bacterium]
MEQNYLTDSKYPKINAMITATGGNLKKLKQEFLWLYFSFWKNLKILLNQNQFDLNFG